MERLEAAEAAADRYEAKYRAAKGELQQTQALNAQNTAKLEQLSESLSSEQAAAQSSQQAVEELTTRLNMVQVIRKHLCCTALSVLSSSNLLLENCTNLGKLHGAITQSHYALTQSSCAQT